MEGDNTIFPGRQVCEGVLRALGMPQDRIDRIRKRVNDMRLQVRVRFPQSVPILSADMQTCRPLHDIICPICLDVSPHLGSSADLALHVQSIPADIS
jgi:hypothetical protein